MSHLGRMSGPRRMPSSGRMTGPGGVLSGDFEVPDLTQVGILRAGRTTGLGPPEREATASRDPGQYDTH